MSCTSTGRATTVKTLKRRTIHFLFDFFFLEVDENTQTNDLINKINWISGFLDLINKINWISGFLDLIYKINWIKWFP